ncbi:MAG TPA: hypothetical protein VEX68_13065 [Bryobacteraceae bacterium]|nr:hypothetical protein [Bryobacteraceae bacterium]
MSRSPVIFVLASIILLAPTHLHSQGYGGPSLLSRGGNQPGQRGRAPVDFNFYGATRGTYDTGLLAPLVDEEGNLSPVDSYGVQFEFGAYGAKSWKKTSMGLDYRGDYRKYSQANRFSGVNQALALDFTYRPARRLTYFNRLTAGTTNRAFGAFSAPAFSDQDNFGVPLNEVYDSRANFAQVSGGVVYQASARSIYMAMGEGYVIKRKNNSLIGIQGYRAVGSYSYRLTRSDTVGVTYDYIVYNFPRAYGNAVAHSAIGTYQRRLNRNWQLELNAGLYGLTAVGTEEVQLSPEIAAILGRRTGFEAFSRTSIVPQFEFNASYLLERSRFMASVRSGITPGNGIYMTSRQDSMRFGYSYSGIRRLSLGASAGYTQFRSLALRVGDYESIQVGGGMNYQLMEHLNFSAQIDRRKFESPAVVGRNGTSLAVGLSYSPSRFPLSIW